jgi:hypothetical protein
MHPCAHTSPSVAQHADRMEAVCVCVLSLCLQMSLEHVWWLVNLSSKQLIAAYEDTRFGTLREMTLPRCVEVWGWNPPEAAECVNGAGSAVGE